MKKYFKEEKYFYKMLSIIVLAIVIFAVLPLLYIGRYAVPCADDYTYGYYPYVFWKTTGSLRETFRWALYQVKATYDTWQGTFSSAFLMSISPAIWGEKCYFVTPIIMIGTMIFSHFLLLYVLLVNILKASKHIWCIISGVLVTCFLETMQSPVNAFFWFNGAVHYMFMHSCMIILFALYIKMGTENKKWKNDCICLGACLMAVACGGSNYATALVGLLGVLFLAGCKWFIGQRKSANWIPLLTYAFCFYKNVTAYGNTVRQGNFEKMSKVDAVVMSFEQLFRNARAWLNIPVLLFMLMLIPFIWNVVKATTIRYRYPIVVTLLSICAAACMFTPSLYAMNSPGPDRLLNIAKIWFLLLLVLNIGYWMGYLKNVIEKKECNYLVKECNVKVLSIYMVLIAGLLCVNFVTGGHSTLLNYSSYAAYVSIRTGEASQFYDEYENRLEILNGDEGVVAVPEYSVKPWLLYFDDIEADPYNWKNKAMASWFGKEMVYLIEK